MHVPVKFEHSLTFKKYVGPKRHGKLLYLTTQVWLLYTCTGTLYRITYILYIPCLRFVVTRHARHICHGIAFCTELLKLLYLLLCEPTFMP